MTETPRQQRIEETGLDPCTDECEGVNCMGCPFCDCDNPECIEKRQ